MNVIDFKKPAPQGGIWVEQIGGPDGSDHRIHWEDNLIYGPSPTAWREWEVADEVFLAGGPGNTLVLHQLGQPVLGFRSHDGWHRVGETDLHPDIAERIQPDKRVNIVFDGDWKENPYVRRELSACMAAVRAVGGIPAAVVVPSLTVLGDTWIGRWKATGTISGTELLHKLTLVQEIDDYLRRK